MHLVLLIFFHLCRGHLDFNFFFSALLISGHGQQSVLYLPQFCGFLSSSLTSSLVPIALVSLYHLYSFTGILLDFPERVEVN